MVEALPSAPPAADDAPVLAADLPVEDRTDAEMAVIAASDTSTFGYWWHNQDRARTSAARPRSCATS